MTIYKLLKTLIYLFNYFNNNNNNKLNTSKELQKKDPPPPKKKQNKTKQNKNHTHREANKASIERRAAG